MMIHVNNLTKGFRSRSRSGVAEGKIALELDYASPVFCSRDRKEILAIIGGSV